LDAEEGGLPVDGNGDENSDGSPAIDGDGREQLFGIASPACTPGKKNRAR
jgi:hypothetical protein